MPAVFRKLMILTLALLLLICPALSESAGTQPGYPFPTEVEGYTFVSFADNQQLFMEADLYDISEDLHDIILPVLVTAEYFETVYPGCSLLQLEDFVISSGNDLELMVNMAEQAGTLPPPGALRFSCLHFSHPYITEQASFDVLVSRNLGCAFFSDAPWLAHVLNAWEAKTVSYDEAVEIAKRAFQDHVRDTGWRMPDPDSLTYKGLFLDVLSQDSRLWEITAHEPQTPYDQGNEMSCIFEIQIDADTGEPFTPYWRPETERDAFLDIIKKHTEAKQDPAGHTAAPGIPLPEGSSPLEEDPGEGEPDPDTKLYYNPDGGMFYHLDPCCPSISQLYTPLQNSFTYAQVNDLPYRTLIPCLKCRAPKRK